jgi:hypothetical protein
LKPRRVDRAWGQVAVVKAEDIELSAAEEKLEGLRPIDPQRDLMPGASAANAARAFEFQGDWTLPLTATRYLLQEVKRTSIDRAVARIVHTRRGQLAVQALYRVRTARQRLAFKLPSGIDRKDAFDSQPLRINGQPVVLEQDQNQLYVPLAGRNSEEPFVLEIRYTTDAAQGLTLELPEFPEEPAVQRVYLAAFLPQERTMLGYRGPWNWEQERGLLTPGGSSSLMYDHQLLPWVREGGPGADQAGEGFPVDGTFLLFSTLRPAPGAVGALRLTAWNSKFLYFVSLLVLVAATLAVWRRPTK